MKPTFEDFARMVDERTRQRGPAAVAKVEALREHVRLITDLAARRVEMGLSQTALAKRAGLHQCDISDIEAGKVLPGTCTLLAIVSALDSEVQLVPRSSRQGRRSGRIASGRKTASPTVSARLGRAGPSRG